MDNAPYKLKWRCEPKQERVIALPVEIAQRYETLKAEFPMLNLSKVAAVGVSRVIDELNKNGNLIRYYTNIE